MEDKDAREETGETTQAKPTEEKPQPTSQSLQEEMDELYERYGDAFRRLQ